MSEVVTGVLKLAFGFISNKVRTFGAEKLQDGGLADQKFRGLMVRELDDIKFKLDANARKDLHTSISCLERGVAHLHMSVDESVKNGNPSTSELGEDGKQSQDTTNAGARSAETKPAKKSVIAEDAIALADAIGKLKIVSNTRFESAKGSFNKAEEKAAGAFHNAALSTEERILASKVRIASGILEHLDDPEIAASDCLQYLRELHDMPEIQGIFSVHVKGGIKSIFKKDSRAEIVETVTMINLILAGFISKFTKRRLGVLDWPMIECGTRVVHPIHYEEESLRKREEMKITLPWDKVVYKYIRNPVNVAINSKGDMIGVFWYDDNLRKLDRAAGEQQPFCLKPLPKVKDRRWKSLAIDDDDTVYVLAREDSFSGPSTMTLSVCSTDGNVIHHCSLDFLNVECCDFLDGASITVTKDKNILICSKDSGVYIVHICNNNGEFINGFPIMSTDLCQQSGPVMLQDISHKSDNNEIIIVLKFFSSDDSFLRKLYVFTQEGELRKIIVLGEGLYLQFGRDITFNHVTKNYIVCNYLDGKTCVECVSKTGELRNSLYLPTPRPGDYDQSHLVSHRNGTIALVTSQCILLLHSAQ